MFGPLLFSLYTIIGRHNCVSYHFYAGDTQLYNRLSNKNASSSLDILDKCLHDVKEWMSANKLKLNPDKTEFIVFGTRCQRNNLSKHFPVHILGEPLQPANSVRNLGVWLDSDFSLSKHVQCICHSCFVQLRDFRQIRALATSTDTSAERYCLTRLKSLSCTKQLRHMH